jgi:hypothetical protein
VRDEVIARRASSHRAIIERFERAKAEGDLPAHIDPADLATYLSTLLQGMAVQAGAGASREQLDRLVATSLSVWPGR